MQKSVKLELVINRKTATGLGLDVPPSRLARADAVIERRCDAYADRKFALPND